MAVPAETVFRFTKIDGVGAEHGAWSTEIKSRRGGKQLRANRKCTVSDDEYVPLLGENGEFRNVVSRVRIVGEIFRIVVTAAAGQISVEFNSRRRRNGQKNYVPRSDETTGRY